jgi:hypothetical protein
MACGERGLDQGLGEVGLSEPTGAKEQDGSPLAEEAEGKHLVHEDAVDARGVLEVEVGDSGGVTEVTALVTATEGPGATTLDLGLGDALDQGLVGECLADAGADDLVNRLGCGSPLTTSRRAGACPRLCRLTRRGTSPISTNL